jgi:drug/metabolite transporter (DMT)-like permease
MWFWFALAAAVLGSVETYANKKALHTVSPYLMTWAAFALNTPLVLGYLFLNDKPPKHAWIATVILLVGIVLVRMA